MSASLLIELGTEELPPKALRALAESFAKALAAGLAEADVPAGEARAYASPRRLAAHVPEVADKAPDRDEERLGPAVAAAFDAAGNPTKAAEGFARSCGVAVTELERRETDKGERLAYRGTAPGRSLEALLPELLADALKRLPIPKRMRWGDSEEAFVRPVHWLVALHGGRTLPLQAFGCAAGHTSYGHRFHHPGAIELADADDYVARLENPGYVLVDLERRRDEVRERVAAAGAEDGGQALMDEGLIDEVTALVEWPVALAGSFDERYLALPREVLIATLEGHQRYFPVAGPDGGLLPRFVTVANIDSPEPQRVIAGNERVVRPRLADALFFWEQDRRRGLEALVPGLARVTFQRDLGSLADKGERVRTVAEWLARRLDVADTPVARACTLAKADLLTEMVDEFPELQGTMGRYYAEQAGENEAVAAALEEQYQPRHAGAPIAAGSVGQVLALADRLDTLAGVFGLGQRPSGEKDPFALRRSALGVLRTVIEAGLDVDLGQALEIAAQSQPIEFDREAIVAELLEFHLDRLRGYYADRGVGSDAFESVAALGLRRPLDFDRRIRAVQGFLEASTGARLCGAHKRIRNILKDGAPDSGVDAGLLAEPAEQALHQALGALRDEVEARRAEGDYGAALERLATLEAPVDRFFDEVLVMSDDRAVRDNRLALLAELDAVCRSVADISRLTPAEAAA